MDGTLAQGAWQTTLPVIKSHVKGFRTETANVMNRGAVFPPTSEKMQVTSLTRKAECDTYSCQSRENFGKLAVFLREGGHGILNSLFFVVVRLRSTGNWIRLVCSGHMWIYWEMTSGNCLRFCAGLCQRQSAEPFEEVHTFPT